MSNFIHRFEPASADPVGPTCVLTSRAIEDAGLLEILQTPGAPLGHWGLFDVLLDGTSPDFVFREPIGRAREVKTALSGLFGRFVARAYASEYLHYTHFTHIHSPPLRLDGRSRAEVVRRPRHRGDLPDWAVWSPSAGLGIIEAKGCHSPSGPARILQSAYRQAERAEIRIGGRLARFKRYAIATRWGFALPTPSSPILAVKDPEIEGEKVGEDELDRCGVGIARRHMSAILRPLGHVELATALSELVHTPFRSGEAAARQRVEHALASADVRSVGRRSDGRRGARTGMADDLIGGFVTRGGVLPDRDLSPIDQETLRRLQLSPYFVGVERSAIEAVLAGDITLLRGRQKDAGTMDDIPEVRLDGGGTTVVRLEDGQAEII